MIITACVCIYIGYEYYIHELLVCRLRLLPLFSEAINLRWIARWTPNGNWLAVSIDYIVYILSCVEHRFLFLGVGARHNKPLFAIEVKVFRQIPLAMITTERHKSDRDEARERERGKTDKRERERNRPRAGEERRGGWKGRPYVIAIWSKAVGTASITMLKYVACPVHSAIDNWK